ncbi:MULTISPECIES: PKD domain-containing protein [unclassified Methanosarcina]|uniref:PKD domain-containing protein n=1 Tax=unclassified Methanosarcina TaxID=2644672 RepID=UPI00064E7CE2|nr:MULTISPECIES: PKD domain-containing protein [unclassified Methanosarcina]
MEELEIRNKLITLLGIFIIFSLISGIGAAAEIIVQPGSSIQTAVNNAASGDVITIKPGTYTENIKISTGDLTIRSESGNPDNTIIKAKSSTINVLSVQADNVKISGIKAIGASGSSYSGIYLSGCNNCIIENNKLMSNGRGIYLVSSKGCSVSKNTVTNNGVYGIVLGSSSGNTISGNTASNDARGIHVGSSDGNTLSGNTVTSNSAYGMYVCGLSDRNLIYNNYFNNTNMIIKSGTGNSYNTAKTAGKNIIYGSYIGGNFWGKPDGSGFSNTAVDKDGDGISDSAYSIPNSIYSDYLPLVTPSNPAAPDADFSSNVTSGNAPLNVLFTDASAGTSTAWNWSFGDGTYSTQKNPVHIYSAAGSYTVTLTASNAAGNDTKTKADYIKVTAPQKPVVNYWGSPRSGDAPLTVTFKDITTGSPTAWNWDFGDGTNSTEQNPKHTYSAAGRYTIKLTATNAAGGNTLTKYYYITVTGTSLQTPVASFNSNVTSGNAPLNVLFTDTSTGTPTAWSWNFGDGTNSAVQNPVHKYSSAGTYTVTLTVTNAAGSNTLTKTSYISVGTEAAQTPVAEFLASPTSGNAPLDVTFTDSSTGTPTAWNWNFGDGTTSTDQNPKHTYSTAGAYTVTLTATNAAGSNTATKSSYITAGTTEQKPVVNFWGSPRSGNAPLSVAFKDITTGSPTAWNWDFGDGTNSTEQNPKHTYSAAGRYTIKLTATNAAGSNTLTKYYYTTVTGTAAQTPVAAFSASPTSGNAPLDVTFTDSSTGTPTAWSWNFGDGTSSTQKSPTHTYSTAGTYTVTLTATNAAGSNTVTKSSYITAITGGTTAQKPVVNFWGTPRSGNAPLTVTFKDITTGTPTAWNWDFGDGTSSTDQNPKHTYSTAGNYVIKLTATNAAGSTTMTKYNYIVVTGTAAQTPIAAFSASPTSGNTPLNVAFTDSSTGTPTAWSWNFGDGTSSTQKSPTHTYSTAGTYTVTLTVTNAAGSNTATKSSYITAGTTGTGTTTQKPVINCWGSPRTGTAPLNVYFKDSSTGSPTAWNWSFGDGTYSTLQNPKHTYSAAGSYTIKLTVTNAAGSTSVTKYNYIVVSKA